jgi:hypothetical protein
MGRPARRMRAVACAGRFLARALRRSTAQVRDACSFCWSYVGGMAVDKFFHPPLAAASVAAATHCRARHCRPGHRRIRPGSIVSKSRRSGLGRARKKPCSRGENRAMPYFKGRMTVARGSRRNGGPVGTKVIAGMRRFLPRTIHFQGGLVPDAELRPEPVIER